MWWPVEAPENPAKDPLGALAQRRITDLYAVENPLDVLGDPGPLLRARRHRPRLDPADPVALDARGGPGPGPRARSSPAAVEAEADNPAAELLARWLEARLKVRIDRVVTAGPVVTAVRLGTANGEIVIDRPEGPLATLSLPGQPSRTLALKVRTTSELIAEELRRLDADEMYAVALRGEATKETPSHV